MRHADTGRSRIADAAALGAEQPDAVWMVGRRGVSLAGLGIVIGLLGAAARTRLMERLLFGVNATDPMTFLAAAAALGIASMAATCCST